MANQLYRNRQSLSPAALCHLALAFAEMDRRQTASELLAMLTNRNLDEPPPRAKWLSWNQSATELHALYAVALEKTLPRDNRLREQIDWLMAHRTGHRWSPDKATGPAMLALCRWFAETRHEGEKYKLAIYVNDKLAGELDVDKETGTQTIEVPTELLADGKQSIRFQLTGRGQFTYQCVLGGFVAADQLKSTTADWTVVRYCEPANLEVDGKTIPRGFTVLQGSYRSFRNELRQLPVGRRGHVELVVRRHHVPVNTRQEQLEYLVVTEPLPAGVTVVEGSVKGGFERFEITPGSNSFLHRHQTVTGTDSLRSPRVPSWPIPSRSDNGAQRLSAGSDRRIQATRNDRLAVGSCECRQVSPHARRIVRIGQVAFRKTRLPNGSSVPWPTLVRMESEVGSVPRNRAHAAGRPPGNGAGQSSCAVL